MTSEQRTGAPWGAIVLSLLISLAVVGLIAVKTEVFASGFIGADESAHFLNSYFVADYLRHGFGQNPIAYAQEFYLHYPKLSIGHWPPAYYGVVGLLFLVIPATATNAMAISLAISVLPSAFVAWVIGRQYGIALAVAAALWLTLLPLTISLNYFLQVDHAVTAAILAAAASWIAFARRPGVPLALLTAGLFAFAVLIKGNAISLALFVPLHIAFTRRWALLRDWRTYLVAAAALIVVAPWYAITAAITADGFKYEASLEYAGRAITGNVKNLYDQFGAAGLALAALGATAAFRARRTDSLVWDWAAAALAILVATLVLHSVLPVDITRRYMAPAVPGILALAIAGIVALLTLLRRRLPPIIALGAAALAFAATLTPAAAGLSSLHKKPDMRTREAAQIAGATAAPAIWLVDGFSGDEGAVIAMLATQLPAQQRYVTRASQLLSSSDFMGRNFKLKVHSTSDVLAELRELGVAGVVIVRRSDKPAFGHSNLLLRALASPASGYSAKTVLPVRNAAGTTYVFVATQPPVANLRRLRSVNFPAKAKGLGAEG